MFRYNIVGGDDICHRVGGKRHGYWEENLFQPDGYLCGHYDKGVEVGVWYRVGVDGLVMFKELYDHNGDSLYFVKWIGNKGHVMYCSCLYQPIHFEED